MGSTCNAASINKTDFPEFPAPRLCINNSQVANYSICSSQACLEKLNLYNANKNKLQDNEH